MNSGQKKHSGGIPLQSVDDWRKVYNPILNRLADFCGNDAGFPNDTVANIKTAASQAYPLIDIPLPSLVYLPLSYRGRQLTPCVKENDTVTENQRLVFPDNNRIEGHVKDVLPGLPCPVNGTIATHQPNSGDEDKPYNNHLKIVVDKHSTTASTGSKQQTACYWQSDRWHNNNRQGRLVLLREAGITGHGGGGFLLASKLAHPISQLIVNAVECEPLISCDAALLSHAAVEVMQGILDVIDMSGCSSCVIALEADSSLGWKQALLEDALATIVSQSKPTTDKADKGTDPGCRNYTSTLTSADTGGKSEFTQSDAKRKTLQQLIACISFHAVSGNYPLGAERLLIDSILASSGKGASRRQHPVEQGICCINVATCRAVNLLSSTGMAPNRRIVTLCGDAIDFKAISNKATSHPAADVSVGVAVNIQVQFGTPVRHVLEYFEIDPESVDLIQGGPVCGVALDSADSAVMPNTNCIVVSQKQAFRDQNDKAIAGPGDAGRGEQPCIRCSECHSACPVGLLPQELHRFIAARDLDRAEKLDLDQCLLCGCCDLVCPSHIPLTTSFREARTEIKQHFNLRQNADLAEQRYKLREQRLQQPEQEKQRKRNERRQVTTDANAKKKAISDALARARTRSNKPGA